MRTAVTLEFQNVQEVQKYSDALDRTLHQADGADAATLRELQKRIHGLLGTEILTPKAPSAASAPFEAKPREPFQDVKDRLSGGQKL